MKKKLSEKDEKIRQAIKHLKVRDRVTIKEMKGAAGCSDRTIQAILSGERPATKEIAEELAKYFRVDYESLLSLGNMILSNDPELEDAILQFENKYRISGPARHASFVLIPKYKARLSGGPGSLETSDQIEGNFAFRKDWISKKGGGNSLALFEVKGDSMLPVIADGDVVLVNMAQNDIHDITDGKIYAFREDHTVKVKRLVWQNNKLWALSDNLFIPGYEKYEVDSDAFHLIGKVVWVGHEVD